jgi:hypothetical protein
MGKLIGAVLAKRAKFKQLLGWCIFPSGNSIYFFAAQAKIIPSLSRGDLCGFGLVKAARNRPSTRSFGSAQDEVRVISR